MKLNAQDLKEIVTLTLEHYNRRAEEFWAGIVTMSARTSRRCCNTSSVRHVSQYLTLAAGPGETSKWLPSSVTSRSVWRRCTSHYGVVERIAEDGLSPTCARAYSGCEVWQQDFLKLDLPNDYFDGVFANAALFHVPSQELPRVLLELHASLKSGGVLFSSNPHGHNEEGWDAGRYGVYYDLHTWRRYVTAAGFVELSNYYRPAGLPRERQPWLASVWRR